MHISAIAAKIGGYNNISSTKKAYQPMPKINTLSADTYTFRGSKKNNNIAIIPAQNPTSIEKNIEKEMDTDPLPTTVKKFANGETYINISNKYDKLRGKKVFIMPSSCINPNDRLMETYLKADAAKRAGAKSITAVIPSFDYARQERKVENGEPIAAKLNMDLLKTSGVDEVITVDLHSPAIEGFAGNSMSITHLNSLPVIANYIKNKNISDLVVVSPDLGGTKRVEKLAEELKCPKAIIHKHRAAHNEAEAKDLIGSVEGKNCVIYDDMIDTAGTIAQASKMLKANGAKDVYVCATHGLFNGAALERLNDAPIKEVIVTNTFEAKENMPQKIKVLDMAKPVVHAIESIATA